jgi:branched-chain amino acid transport system substrate-binding protein
MKRRTLVVAAPAAAVLGWSSIPSRAAARVVRFGQSASLTGGQAGYGEDVQRGIAAAFAAASADEATTGLRYELVTLDDGGIRGRCLKNAITLVESGVTALIGLTSGAGAEACLPVIEDTKIAMLGTASGNMGIRAAGVSGAFHVRAGYDFEYRRMIEYLKGVGLQRVAVVYLGDTSKANMDAMNLALSSLGLAPAAMIAIDRNAASFDSVADELLSAKPDCVLFTANAAPVAKIINRMRLAKYAGLFYASSFAGQDLLDALAAKQQSCVMSVVVPRPSAVGNNVVATCKRDLALYGSGARLGITSLEGYIAGRVAVEGVRVALKGGALNPARLKEALAGLRTDLGGYRIDFASGAHGSNYVDLLAIDRYGRLIG